MPLISADDQTFLRDKFAKELVNTVDIVLFTQGDSPLTVRGQECAYCKETRQLVEEVSALSDKINLAVRDFVADAEKAKQMGVDKIPAIVLDSGTEERVKYYGIPSGYEFSSFVEDIIDVSKRSTNLKDNTKQALAQLTKDVHIQVFVTPT
ncbi:MAG: thioredoxin family protein [Chloroflexi bacterium]|nr:thioredoxin family protein [Chloroflexota bacterium]